MFGSLKRFCLIFILLGVYSLQWKSLWWSFLTLLSQKHKKKQYLVWVLCKPSGSPNFDIFAHFSLAFFWSSSYFSITVVMVSYDSLACNALPMEINGLLLPLRNKTDSKHTHHLIQNPQQVDPFFYGKQSIGYRVLANFIALDMK